MRGSRLELRYGSGVLRDWLGAIPYSTFRAELFQRLPWANAGTARAQLPLLDWATLDRVLRSDPGPDVLVVARGALVDAPIPRSMAECAALMARGIGLCVRHSERHEPGLATVAEAFRAELGGEVQVQLFVTPAGTHGFGWHYDIEDVFIAQTIGVKDYYFKANTVDPALPRGVKPDFERYRAETSPLATARLVAGDTLYIPSRWWHMAKCHADALSISVGAFPDLAAMRAA